MANISKVTKAEAKILAVSEVGKDGVFEVIFDLYLDKVLTYPRLSVNGTSREEIIKKMTVIANDLVMAIDEKGQIQVDETINIPLN